jgi:hypothetical protein
MFEPTIHQLVITGKFFVMLLHFIILLQRGLLSIGLFSQLRKFDGIIFFGVHFV